MATYLHNDMTDARIIPLSGIKLYVHDGVTEHTIEYKNLLDGAKAAFTPVADSDDEGMNVTQAYKLDVTASIYENNVQDMLPELRLLSRNKVTKIILTCTPTISQSGGGQLEIQVRDSISVNSMRCSWNLNIASETDQTLDLAITGLFSTDVMDMTTNPLFKQSWST
jgi:hypothetical protein